MVGGVLSYTAGGDVEETDSGFLRYLPYAGTRNHVIRTSHFMDSNVHCRSLTARLYCTYCTSCIYRPVANVALIQRPHMQMSHLG
jgi:hypothetical protein